MTETKARLRITHTPPFCNGGGLYYCIEKEPMTQEIISKVIDAIDIPDRYFFTPKQVAEILHLPERSVWDYIKKYKVLFAIRLIYQYRIPRVALEHFIRKGMECVFEDEERIYDKNGDKKNDMQELDINKLLPRKKTYNKEELSAILQITERSIHNYIRNGYLLENDNNRLDRNSIIHFLETMK